jgi:hypothetical protein
MATNLNEESTRAAVDFRIEAVTALRQLNYLAPEGDWSDFDLQKGFALLVAEYKSLLLENSDLRECRRLTVERSRELLQRTGEMQRNLNSLKTLAFEIRSSTEESEENASARSMHDDVGASVVSPT